MGNIERIFKISEMLIAFSKKTFVLGNEQIVECALSAVNFLCDKMFIAIKCQ